MKKQEVQIKKSTTNYAPDSHKEFCKRCFAHNGRCTNPGGPKACSL